ncbi:MAG TPA: methyltransferase domain-containing protein [Parachlamydiaceae bacterium]|nr:methyltransferase domain-containing protein [Parachlamydiaceae bacterium]
MINLETNLIQNFVNNKVDGNLKQPLINPIAFHSTGSATNPSTSDFRRVFQTSDQLKVKFAHFLNTIFYQLDEKKVFDLMEKLLEDPSKSDEEVYNELRTQINSTKKAFPVLSKLWSLHVLKKGMGQQAGALLKGFRKEKFQDYMEVYDRRYLNTIRAALKFPLKGNSVAVCNSPEVGLADRIQAGAFFSSYPYKQFEPLNDPDCTDPFLFTEKTYRPISDRVADNSSDIIAILGGLHHIPPSRVDGFVDSLHRKLKAGGVILLRDHNVSDPKDADSLAKEDLRAIAAIVHTFVNAENGVEWKVEKNEIREFKSVEDCTRLMENHGFKRISEKELVLKDDPTENAMFAFVKAPTSLEELKAAISYRNDCTRPKEGTMATWIEWGNVRFSKQYAEYIQNHHASAFDSVGHLNSIGNISFIT